MSPASWLAEHERVWASYGLVAGFVALGIGVHRMRCRSTATCLVVVRGEGILVEEVLHEPAVEHFAADQLCGFWC